jgi:hypothetical protein
MKYYYEIHKLPQDVGGYNAIAFTEGDLKVAAGEVVFLEAEGVLLVEFAVVLARWMSQLAASGPSDLYYASMDFEEEPIFELRLAGDTDSLILRSAWAKRKELVTSSLEDAVHAARTYIESLERDLRRLKGVELSAIIGDAIARS